MLLKYDCTCKYMCTQEKVQLLSPLPSIPAHMLMDIAWIGVIGTGTLAKATAFMYSEVVSPTASLRHSRILETPPARAGGSSTPAVELWPRATARCLTFSGRKMFIHLII